MMTSHPAAAAKMSVDALLSESAWLRALCRQLIRDADRAEDLFQETVLASIRDAEQRRGALRPWLASIARHTVMRIQTAERRRKAREAATARPEALSGAAEAAEKAALQQQLIGAVRQLPEAQRDVLLLRYFEDLPPREIALRLDTPVPTVKTRLKRGLAALRERLDTEFGDRATWMAALLPLSLPVGAGPGVPASVAGSSAAGALATKRAALFALTAAILGGTTWIAWPRDDALPSTDGPAATRVAAASTGRTADMTERPSPTTPPEGRTVASAAGATGQEDVAVTGPTIDVLVAAEVDGSGDGRGVPGVTVRYARTDPAGMEQTDRRELERQVETGDIGYDEFLRRLTTPVETDAEGIAHIPLPEDAGAEFLLVAESDGRDGQLEISADDLAAGAVPKLELRARPEVRVEVVDSSGEPAARVPLRYSIGPAVYARGTTGAAGEPCRLVIPYADPRLLEFAQVTIDLPLAEQVSRFAPPTGADDAPMQLELPETGSVEVRVLEADGRPVSSGVLRLELPHDDPTLDASPTVSGELLSRVPVTDGLAIVPQVGLDIEFRVRVLAHGHTDPLLGRVDGPKRAGERASGTVRAEAETEAMLVRLLSPIGESLGGKRIRGWLHWPRYETIEEFETHLDPTGRLRLNLDPELLPESVTVCIAEPGQPADRPPLGARLTPEASLLGQVVDRRLQPARALVAGRVVDALDRPVVSAEVRLTTGTAIERAAERGRTADELDPHPGLSARTDRKGRFFVFGFDPAPNFRVHARRADLAERTIDVVPNGREDLRIVLAKGRLVRIPLQTGGDAWPDFRMVPMDAAAAAPREVSQEPDGTLLAAGVPPGTYELRFSLLEGDTPLHVRRLVVPAGDDPFEAEPVDLRGVVNVIEVRVETVDGTPVPDVWCRTEASGTSIFHATDERGIATMLAPRDGLTIEVLAEGYETVLLESVADDRVVQLRKR